MRESDFDDNGSEAGNHAAIDKLINSIEENTLTVRDAALTNSIMETGFTNSLKKTTDSILDLSKVLKDTAAEQKRISEKQDKSTDKSKGKFSEDKLNSMNSTLSQMLKIMSDSKKSPSDNKSNTSQRAGVIQVKPQRSSEPEIKSSMIQSLLRKLGVESEKPKIVQKQKEKVGTPRDIYSQRNNIKNPSKEALEVESKVANIDTTSSQILEIMNDEYELQKKIEDRELRAKERGKGVYKAKDNTKPAPMNKIATNGGGGGLIGGLSKMLGLGGLLPMLTGMMKKIIFAPFKLLGKVVKLSYNLLQPLVKIMLKSGAKLLTLVGKIFSPITKLLGNIGGKLLAKLTPIFSKIGGVFSKIFSPITKFLGNIGGKLLSKLTPIFSKIGGVFSKIFSPITKFLGNIGGKLLSKLTGVFGKMGGVVIVKIFSKLFSKLPMLAAKALPKLLAGLNIVGDIVMALSLIWKYIRGFLLDWTKDSPILHKIVTMLDDIIMPISDFFDHLTDLVVGIFTGNGEAVWDNIVKMGEDLLKLAMGVFQPLIDGFDSLTGVVKDWIKNSPVAQNLLNGIEAIFAPIKAVIDWVVEKAGKLAKWLGLDKMVDEAKKGLAVAKKVATEALAKTAAATKAVIVNSVNKLGDAASDNVIEPIGSFVLKNFKSKDAAANEAKVLQAGKNAGLSGTALANFMAQTDSESGSFSKTTEGFNYTSLAKLKKAFGNRLGNDEESSTYLRNPEKLAHKIYEGRTDLGNTTAGDGYKYRGRGFIQLTGKYNYEKYGKLIGQDLLKNPDLAAQPDIAAKLAAVYYKESGAAGLANKGDLHGARLRVNAAGLEEANIAKSTKQYVDKLAKTEWVPSKLPDVKTAPVTPDVRKPAAPVTPDVKKPAIPAIPANPLTSQEKDLAKMRGITDTNVAMTSARGVKFNSAGERIGADIKPVEKPVANVAMENIKEIPKVDKNAQAQTALLSGINNNTAATTISNFGMDELPHSDTLLAAITGRGA
ncbi:MAG: putative chitinase [Pseudomonadota bacterium]|nr:putative chitinase [Pseudomonadota bacterium]